MNRIPRFTRLVAALGLGLGDVYKRQSTCCSTWSATSA